MFNFLDTFIGAFVAFIMMIIILGAYQNDHMHSHEEINLCAKHEAHCEEANPKLYELIYEDG